jgi:hypothetical protein
MRRISHIQAVARSEFVLHITTEQVGVVTCVCTAGIETYKTIRLAEGELLTAPAREFRPATAEEIERRHRAAAALRSLALPALPAAQSRACSHPPGG